MSEKGNRNRKYWRFPERGHFCIHAKLLQITNSFLTKTEMYYSNIILSNPAKILSVPTFLLNSNLPWPTSLLYSAIDWVLLRDELDKRQLILGPLVNSALFKYNKTLPGSHSNYQYYIFALSKCYLASALTYYEPTVPA